MKHANREMTFGTAYWPRSRMKLKKRYIVLDDVTVLVFMLGFQSDCGFAHEEKRRNIQEMSDCEDQGQANQGHLDLQFVPDHGSGRSGVLNFTRRMSISLSNHHWQPQAVEPCMCETSLTCSGSLLSCKGQRGALKWRRETRLNCNRYSKHYK